MSDDGEARLPFPMLHATLRAMPADQRAETIVGMFKIAAAEWAAMVLEHVEEPPGIPTPPPSKAHEGEARQVREMMQTLDVESRCAFLGSLFGQICSEFAALVGESRGSTH